MPSSLTGKTASTIPDSLQDQATKAVKVFRGMQHGLTSYARAITGNKAVRIEVSTGPPRTNGTVIYYSPPLALGDNTPHNRELCELRTESGLKACRACRTREEILVNIYHEVSHIAFQTFKDGKNWLQEAAQVSAFLPFLVNCLEDSRVDSAMFEARRGTRKMMFADVFNTLREGMPKADGTIMSAHEAPLNTQVSYVSYLEIAGYEGWQEFFHPKVVQDVASPAVQATLATARDAVTAEQIYSLAVDLFSSLRDLGYFLTPEEQQDPEPDPEPETQEETDDGEQDPGEDGEESGDSGGAGDVSEADPSSEGDGAPGDEAVQDAPSDAGEEGGQPEDEGLGDDRDGDDADRDGDGGAGEDGAPEDGEPAEGAEPDDSEGGRGDQAEPSGPEHEGDLSDGADSDEVSDGADERPEPDGEGGGDGEESDGEGGRPGDSDDEAGESPDGSADDAQPDGSGGSGQEEGGELVEDGVGSDGGEIGDLGDPSPELDAHDGEGREGDEAHEDSTEGGVGQPDDASDGDDSGSAADEGADDSAQAEALESGADKGEGGIEVDDVPLPEQGHAEDLEAALAQLHSVSPHREDHEDEQADLAMTLAILQGTYFETPSLGVLAVLEHHYAPDEHGWDSENMTEQVKIQKGVICDMDIPETVLGPALLKTRRIFSDNKTTGYQPNLRSGRVNAKVLGRRAWKGDDDRLFGKKRIPAKQDYAVLIVMDVSSSNTGDNLALLKRSVQAQAELCNRVGVKFSIVAHSCCRVKIGEKKEDMAFGLDLFHIKDWSEAWDSKVQKRLADIMAVGGNLDGHAMEYARKRLAEVDATDKIMLYYTDGKFPAANKEEELVVLQKQLKLCKRDQITLLGVGIRTDSPVRHGLDTVQVDGDDDLASVVTHLGKRLAGPAR